MIFGDAYYSAMDRGFYMPVGEGEGPSKGYGSGESLASEDVGVSPADIGISTHPGQDQLQQLKARVFQGASKVELGFFGRGKGSLGQGNTNPEMYGKEDRIDMRELAKINKLSLTTHATTAAGSLAGMKEGGFDEHTREQAYHEIQRAVDFAADVSNGGAIVVHANEFPRPFVEKYDDEKFSMYPKEKEQAVHYLVDDRTGKMEAIRRNDILYEPEFEETEDGKYWKGQNGEKIAKEIFYSNKPEDVKKLFERIPVWEKGETRFRTKRITWDDMEKRRDEYNKMYHPEKPLSTEEVFFRLQLQNQILQTRGSSLFYGMSYDQEKEQYEKLSRALDYYKRVEQELGPDRKGELKQILGSGAPFVPPEVTDPVEYLEKQKKLYSDRMRMTHQYTSSADVQGDQLVETLQHIKPIEEYARDKSSDTIARAAEYAMYKQNHLRDEVREGTKLDRDLFIAVENFFPEVYGGHPDEIKQMVKDARHQFVEIMKTKGWSESKAEKEATNRIKATWDTGHANIWRKYFTGNDNEFKDWYLKKAKEWKDENIIGHVHITDNFGWEDEHVVPGEGNVPLKEFVKLMKDKVDKGEINLITEPSHQDYRAMLGGWKTFGSSIYGVAGGRRDSWLDVERSYFGRNASPYFLYGDSAPDRDAFTLWSQQPLE